MGIVAMAGFRGENVAERGGFVVTVSMNYER